MDILPNTQENEYLRDVLGIYFFILSQTHSTYHYSIEDRNDMPKLSLFAFRPGAMINPQWLELSMSRTNFHGQRYSNHGKIRLCNVTREHK